MKNLIEKLAESKKLTKDELKLLLSCKDDYLYEKAKQIQQKIFGKQIYIRGLIEFTSYCKNNCYYCGLRLGNKKAERYRLTQEEILESCRIGYKLGFRTFVLQGGEDSYFTDEILEAMIQAIRFNYTDCAVTLSIGERSYESYQRLFRAGASRYLLRQETADDSYYSILHPPEMSLVNRKKCLNDLKKIGYQTGCGFLVGSPKQTMDHIVTDLLFIQELDPAMAGIGPFLAHTDTPFAREKSGDFDLTRNILAILRIMKPNLLIPATTALETLRTEGREMGILAGANVLMMNLSPVYVRKKYLLYDHKIGTEEEPEEMLLEIKRRLHQIGYETIVSKGDYHDL